MSYWIAFGQRFNKKLFWKKLTFQTKHSNLLTGDNSTWLQAVPLFRRCPSRESKNSVKEKLILVPHSKNSQRHANISLSFFLTLIFFFFFFLTRTTDLAEEEGLLRINNSTYWNSPWPVTQSRIHLNKAAITWLFARNSSRVCAWREQRNMT